MQYEFCLITPTLHLCHFSAMLKATILSAAFCRPKLFGLICCFQAFTQEFTLLPQALFGLNYFPFGSECLGLAISLLFAGT